MIHRLTMEAISNQHATKTNGNIGNTNNIKADIDKNPMNMVKWSYIRPYGTSY